MSEEQATSQGNHTSANENEPPEQDAVRGRNRPGSWRDRKAKIQRRWTLPFQWLEWGLEWSVYWLSQWAFLDFLQYAARFSILVAVISYLLGAEDRLKQKHYQAWQVITSAQGKGGSGGRTQALEELNHDGVPLDGVDLSGAWLSTIKLPRATLIEAKMNDCMLWAADMQRATLWRANLAGTYLANANLQGANLLQANLQGTELSDANLQGSDLLKANLQGAGLFMANLEAANLTKANFRGTDFTKANLKGANLAGADLSAALGLTREQIESAVIDGKTQLPHYLKPPTQVAPKSQ